MDLVSSITEKIKLSHPSYFDEQWFSLLALQHSEVWWQSIRVVFGSSSMWLVSDVISSFGSIRSKWTPCCASQSFIFPGRLSLGVPVLNISSGHHQPTRPLKYGLQSTCWSTAQMLHIKSKWCCDQSFKKPPWDFKCKVTCSFNRNLHWFTTC